MKHTHSGPLHDRARAYATELLGKDVITRLWRKDPSLWDAPDALAAGRTATHATVANRLGWLEVPQQMHARLDELDRFVAQVREDGLRDVYLLGMGGSSLCAEVMRASGRAGERALSLHVLDTTDESAIRGAAARMDPAATLFVVASKSGTTVEVSSLERFFHARIDAAARPRATGSYFVAITDPGTALETSAAERAYRATFLNPADIGGRFSALSMFGLVPAALLDLSPRHLVDAGVAHAEGCRQQNLTNPGLMLGAFLGAAALEGRDKLTLLLPPSLSALGLWIEQLVAESTGKHGRGLLPVVDEPLGNPDEYGGDRVFVSVATENDTTDHAVLDALEAAGHPLLRIETRADALGAEFFRWEFATAIAGILLQLNPFDEPNVTEAKERTRALLKVFETEGRLTDPLADSQAIAASGTGTPRGTASAADALRTLLATLGAGDYLAVLSYVPQDMDLTAPLTDLRRDVRRRWHAATTVGIGPRYLHSTGQYHKGGPKTGVFLVLTMDDASATRVPERPYSFSVLKRAQALGDLQALEAHGRRALRLHLPKGEADPAAALSAVFREALSS